MTIVANRLRGRKTYTAAALLAAYAVFGWMIGQHDGGQTVQLIFEAIMAATIRHGIR